MIHGENTGTSPDRDYVSILDEVLKDGFDGVYLDWVEGYDDEDVKLRAAQEGVNAKKEMILFIKEIRQYAQKVNPDFIVIQQNAASLSQYDSKLFSYVDAIAQEHIWFNGIVSDDWDFTRGYDIAVDAADSAYYLSHLNRYKNAGLPVFCCEYALKKAGTAYARAKAQGIIGYCTRISLGRLTTTPPPEY